MQALRMLATSAPALQGWGLGLTFRGTRHSMVTELKELWIFYRERQTREVEERVGWDPPLVRDYSGGEAALKYRLLSLWPSGTEPPHPCSALVPSLPLRSTLPCLSLQYPSISHSSSFTFLSLRSSPQKASNRQGGIAYNSKLMAKFETAVHVGTHSSISSRLTLLA